MLRSSTRSRAERWDDPDNGPEFVSLHLDQWAHWNGVKLDFSRPGRPSDNALCESFNNRVRQEQLNPNWFHSLDNARRQAAAWRVDYNTHHPHSSLGDRTPKSSPAKRIHTLKKPPFLELAWDKNRRTTHLCVGQTFGRIQTDLRAHYRSLRCRRSPRQFYRHATIFGTDSKARCGAIRHTFILLHDLQLGEPTCGSAH